MKKAGWELSSISAACECIQDRKRRNDAAGATRAAVAYYEHARAIAVATVIAAQISNNDAFVNWEISNAYLVEDTIEECLLDRGYPQMFAAGVVKMLYRAEVAAQAEGHSDPCGFDYFWGMSSQIEGVGRGLLSPDVSFNTHTHYSGQGTTGQPVMPAAVARLTGPTVLEFLRELRMQAALDKCVLAGVLKLCPRWGALLVGPEFPELPTEQSLVDKFRHIGGVVEDPDDAG